MAINLTAEIVLQKGVLISENETVYTWAVDLFETYREKAMPPDSDTLTV